MSHLLLTQGGEVTGSKLIDRQVGGNFSLIVIKLHFLRLYIIKYYCLMSRFALKNNVRWLKSKAILFLWMVLLFTGCQRGKYFEDFFRHREESEEANLHHEDYEDFEDDVYNSYIPDPEERIDIYEREQEIFGYETEESYPFFYGR